MAEFKSLKGQKLSVMIQDPHSQIFSEHEKDKIKTAFTTNEAGPHWVFAKITHPCEIIRGGMENKRGMEFVLRNKK